MNIPFTLPKFDLRFALAIVLLAISGTSLATSYRLVPQYAYLMGENTYVALPGTFIALSCFAVSGAICFGCWQAGWWMRVPAIVIALFSFRIALGCVVLYIRNGM